jgi:gas vesicle structural protein
MAMLHAPGESGTLIDVLDRVLDKGIVIDGWARISVVGIDLLTVNGHIVVASIETYLRYSDVLGLNPPNRR